MRNLEIMCQMQVYFTVPEGTPPNEFKDYLKSMSALDMVKHATVLYTSDWQAQADNNEWDYLGE